MTFIGSGSIGAAIAQLTAAASYGVVLSNSRAPETLTDLVKLLGSNTRAATPVEAAAAGDLVGVSVLPRASAAVPVHQHVGKPVVDVSNYTPSAAPKPGCGDDGPGRRLPDDHRS